MAYTKTYVFGETTTVGYLLGTGDRFLLILTFEIEDIGNNVTYLAEDRGLYLIKRGKTALNFDFDQWFIMPAEYEFEVGDLNGEFADLLYEGENINKVNKDFYVQMLIKYSGASNYIVEFSGYNIAETLNYLPIEQRHQFTAIPKTNILFETFLYPLGYDRGRWTGEANEANKPNNPLELSYSRIGDSLRWDWIKLTDQVNSNGLLEKIFQLVNPNIELEVFHDWLFYGDSYHEYGVGHNHQKNDLKFTDLILDGDWVGSVFAYENQNIESVGDLLALLAFEYGCMAGFTSQEKGFFRQMFYFNENEIETMGLLCDDDSYNKKYKYTKIDFADINSIHYKQDTGQLNRYFEDNFNPRGFAPNSLVTKIAGRNGLTKSIVSVADYKNQILSGFYDYVSNMKAVIDTDPDAYYSIYAVKHPLLNFSTILFNAPEPNYLGLSHFLAEYNYTLKGLLYQTQIHEFTFEGLYYNFMKGFQRDGYNFSKVGQEKDWDLEITTIESIRIDEVSKEIENESPGDDVTTPVSLMSMKVVPGEIALSYEQISQEAIPIAYMAVDEWLDEFIIQVEVPFVANEIANFRIYDGSGTLVTFAQIMGKFTTVLNSQSIRKVKKYIAADTIFLEWTQGVETPSAGQGSLIIKKMVKA